MMKQFESPFVTEVNPTVWRLVDAVPAYNSYGTHRQQLNHFEQLSEATQGSDVAVDMQTLGTQTAPDGTQADLVQTTMTLNQSDGMTVYLKGGVHGNELVYRPVQRHMSRLALRYPELFAKLGIDRLVFFDADPVTADMNNWPAVGHTLFQYFKGVRRGTEQADWDYPIDHPNFVHESTVPGCIGSQKIIQGMRPRLVIPQHNADIGSWYMYMTGEPAEMADDVSAFMHRLYGGFPAQHPDMENPVELAYGVYVPPSLEDDLILHGGEGQSRELVPWGETSSHYAQHLARQQAWSPASGLTVETAYHRSLALADPRPSGVTQREAIAKNKVHLDNVSRAIEYYLPKVSGGQNDEWGLAKDIEFYGSRLYLQSKELQSREGPNPDAIISKAELAGLTTFNFWTTRSLGMLANLADKQGSVHQWVIDDRLHNECEFLDSQLRTVAESPQLLVQSQVGSIAVSALAISRAA